MNRFTMLLLALALPGAAGAQDPDADALPTPFETWLGSDPKRSDTDGDGAPDGVEAAAGTDPARPESRPARALGARVLAWQEGGRFTVLFVVASPSRFEAFERIEAAVLIGTGAVPAPPRLRLDALLPLGRLALASDRGAASIAFDLPFAAVLVGNGRNWSFGLRLADGGLVAHDEVAVLKRGGRLWLSVPQGSGRVILRRAGPVGLAVPQRVCGQTLEAIEAPVMVVVDESCEGAPDECVPDCGVMIGGIVLLLDPFW
jgi:hypothetical protein